MSGRNDGNSGSPETRRVTEYKDGQDATNADNKGATGADSKAAENESEAEPEDDTEVDRQASGE